MNASSERSVIVCVDDESSILEAARSQLRDHLGARFDIETALSGAEALELIEELIEDGIEVPLIISDEIMPEMRGHDFLATVHKLLPDTRKVLMTGQAGVEAVVASVNGADLFHYIAKPWSKVDLTLTVDRAVESYAALIDRRRRLETFHRFVPSGFLRLLDIEDPIEVGSGLSTEAEVTILFTDIQGFSGMSERVAPHEVLASLNQVFGMLVPLIESRGGIVDKFIGDAVMAIFTDASAALQSAVDLTAAVNKLETPMGRIRLGVGVHSGRAVLGTVGTTGRLETTAIGDVVNTAARVESMTRQLCSAVLCTQEVADQTDEPLRYVGRFRVKGRRRQVAFYQPLAVYSDALRRDIEAAAPAFQALVAFSDEGGVPPCSELDQYREAVPSDPVAHALAAILERRSRTDL